MSYVTETLYLPLLRTHLRGILNEKTDRMNGNEVDKAFRELIKQRAIHKKLNETSSAIRNLRWKVGQGIPISTDRKLELLKKSGWSEDGKKFSRHDVISIINYWKKTSQAARDQGAEHVLENWERLKK